MSVLLVDIGNTRVKWARLGRAGEPGRMRAAPHAGWSARQFREVVLAGMPPDVRVVAVGVAAPRVLRAFELSLRELRLAPPEWVRSSEAAAGVRNGYREAWRLGADRWVALLGARALCGDGKAACVVDVGTAVTIDLLDGKGHHLGGAIVPGPELMVASLLASTGGIRRRAQEPGGAPPSRRRLPRDLFATATAAALDAGARHAVAAVVERAAAQAVARLGSAGRRQAPEVLLTGGAAPGVGRLLGVAHRVVPDLVLRGLAAVA